MTDNTRQRSQVRKRYIEYVLRRIGEADTVEKLEALLPWNVKAALAAK